MSTVITVSVVDKGLYENKSLITNEETYSDILDLYIKEYSVLELVFSDEYWSKLIEGITLEDSDTDVAKIYEDGHKIVHLIRSFKLLAILGISSIEYDRYNEDILIEER